MIIADAYQKPCDIIIIAGQSNAAGYGRGDTERPFEPDPRIWRMDDRADAHHIKGEDGKTVFHCPEGTEIDVDVAEEYPDGEGGKRGCFAWSFARAYLESGTLSEGRSLLVVMAAVGGTGFARREWGIEDAVLYRRLCRMTDTALSLHRGNRIVAILWHQGECDASELPDLTLEERYTRHRDNLTEMFTAYRTRYALRDVPVIAGEFCHDWQSLLPEKCDAVIRAMREVCDAVVPTSDLQSNRAATGNDDGIHFSRDAQYRLGLRYFDAYVALLKKKSKNNS